MASSQRIITTSGTQKGQWTRDEDERLIALIQVHGASGWKRYNGFMDGRRSAKQCRERWHQNLDPGLNHKPILPEEGERIIDLVDKHGQKWAKIAKELKNHRSDNHVKNWWNGSQNKAQRSITKTNIAVNAAKPRPISPFDRRDHHPARNLMYSNSGLLPPHTHHLPMAPPSLTIPAPLSIHRHELILQPPLPSTHHTARPSAFVTPTRATFDLPQLSPASTSTFPTNSPVTPPAGTYASFHRHYLPQGTGQQLVQPPTKPAHSIPTSDLDVAHDLLTLAKHAPSLTDSAAGYPAPPPRYTPSHKGQTARHYSSSSDSGRISIANLMN